MPDRELLDLATDEALSALVDGELDTAAERALHERAESEPALARRLAELEAVDSQLRALPVPEVPADLRARLRARIAAEDGVALLPLLLSSPSSAAIVAEPKPQPLRQQRAKHRTNLRLIVPPNRS